MRIKQRVLTILLSITMLLTFMPALSFAQSADTHNKKIPRSMLLKAADNEDGDGEEEEYDVYDLDETDIKELSFSHNNNESPVIKLTEEDDLYNSLQTGDSVTITTCDEEDISFYYDSDEEEFVNRDEENSPLYLDYEKWYLMWVGGSQVFFCYIDDIEEYEDDIDIDEIDAKDVFPITIMNAITEAEFNHGRSVYSSAEMKLYETYYEDEGVYEYDLDFLEGDIITVTWGNGEKTKFRCNSNEEFIYASGYTGNGTRIECEWPHYESSTPIEDQVGSEPLNLVFTVKVDSLTEEEFEGTCYIEATATINIIPTRDEDEQNLIDTKLAALEELTDMTIDWDWDAYDDAEQDKIEKIFDRAYYDIIAATSQSAVGNVLKDSRTSVGKVKTKAQKKAEADAAARAASNAAAEAAANAEWNGVLNGSIPKINGLKVKASKGKAKLSWKKASKKNLKKFDRIEIQACPDGGFGRANTIRMEVGKKKKSATVKGLAKKTTYFVRVRGISGAGAGKQVSAWSKVKKVKIK